MKGAVFIALNEMLEEQHGLATWLKVLELANVEGAYTGTKNYADEELFALVSAVCKVLEAPQETVLRLFGHYLFHYLHKAHSVFAESQPDFFSFIDSIDGVIHVEVHKLDENANTPTISVERLDSRSALLTYSSPRKLCHLAEGLLQGAAEYFGIAISIEHLQCMHQGATECHLRLVQA